MDPGQLHQRWSSSLHRRSLTLITGRCAVWVGHFDGFRWSAVTVVLGVATRGWGGWCGASRGLGRRVAGNAVFGCR